MPQNENFYNYQPVNKKLVPALKKIGLDAYIACGGKGYTRADTRQDKITGKLYMLEVNAQCGLSEDEDYTSIGAILKVSGVSFTQIIAEILKDAMRRNSKKEARVHRVPLQRKTKTKRTSVK